MIRKITLQTLFLLSVLCISCGEDDEEVADTTPPTVSFTIKGIQNTVDLPIIGNTIEIEISAQDAEGISKVEAFLNDTKVGEDREAPFKITIDLTLFSKNLSGKGTVINSTLTQYTLKIAATDIFGNVSAKEKDVLVDNEMPTITEVSLENETVIGGSENEVTFKANDNEEITSLEVKINEVVIEPTVLDSISYAINIDASLLEDGQNNLSITASDEADNKVTYTAPFLVDKSGPEITLEGLAAQSNILDETSIFSISAEDLYSEVDSLKIYINDSLLVSSGATDVSLDFNPDDYDTGDTTLSVHAIDAVGNESTHEVNFVIKRMLLKINIPDDFLNPALADFYVYASDSSGEVIAIERLEFNTSLIKLNTLADVSLETEYMVNFAFRYNNSRESSYIKTIQNVTRAVLDKINVKIPKEATVSAQNTYQASEMPNGTTVFGKGPDYGLTYGRENGLFVQDFNVYDTNAESSGHYMFYYNSQNKNYAYQFVEKPVATDFTLEFDNFSTDGIETRYLNSAAIQDPGRSSMLSLYGYLNATDFENDVAHLMWLQGYHNVIILSGPGFKYSLNTNFYKYRYQLTMENYHIETIGEPLENYNAPDWSIDYSYSSTNKTFSLSKTGTSHNIGKIWMTSVGDHSSYNWTVLFDSQKSNEVILPRLPEVMQSWDFNNDYNIGDLHVSQIEVKSYDGLDTYNDFLQTVIKDTQYKKYKVSDKIETVFKSFNGIYENRPDISYYY